MRIFGSICAALVLSACAQQQVMQVPSQAREVETSKITNASFDEAWQDLVSDITKSFFVINNLEKDSGVINVSFSSNSPEQYVDCGQANVQIDKQSNWIERAASGSYPWVYQQGIYQLVGRAVRQSDLEGRVNMFVQEKEPGKTEVTVNTRYILNVKVSGYTNRNVLYGTESTTSTFNTNSTAILGTEGLCRATGKLESDLLAFVN